MARIYIGISGLLLFTALICNAGQMRILNGNIIMEYVTDPLGGKPFMVFYDRILSNPKHYTVVSLKNKMSQAECRMQSLTRGYKFCSILTHSNQTVECRISWRGIRDSRVLLPEIGAITYVQETQGVYWPYNDGIFYYRIRNVNYTTALRYCSPSKTRLMPVLEEASTSRKDIFKYYAGQQADGHIFLGTEKEGAHHFKWHNLGSRVADIYYWGVLVMNSNGNYHRVPNEDKRDTVCMYNLFNIPW